MPNRSLNDKVKRDTVRYLGASKRRAIDLPINTAKHTMLGPVMVVPPTHSNLGSFSKDKRVAPRWPAVPMPEAYGPSIYVEPGKAYSGLQRDVGTCGRRNAVRAVRCHGNGERTHNGDRAGYYNLFVMDDVWPLLKSV